MLSPLLAALLVGQPLPSLTLRDAAGGPVSLAHRGSPLLLQFWASWCGPCRAELPLLLRAQQAGRLRLLAVNVGETPQTVRRYLAAERLSALPVAYTDGASLNRLQVPGLPASFVLDGQGRLLGRAFGPLDEAGLNRLLGR